MRLLLVLALLLSATVARADTLADLNKPASTIAGCVTTTSRGLVRSSGRSEAPTRTAPA